MLNAELKQIATQNINLRVNTVGKQIQSYLFTCCINSISVEVAANV